MGTNNGHNWFNIYKRQAIIQTNNIVYSRMYDPAFSISKLIRTRQSLNKISDGQTNIQPAGKLVVRLPGAPLLKSRKRGSKYYVWPKKVSKILELIFPLEYLIRGV